jgi:hypothetical protein
MGIFEFLITYENHFKASALFGTFKNQSVVGRKICCLSGCI